MLTACTRPEIARALVLLDVEPDPAAAQRDAGTLLERLAVQFGAELGASRPRVRSSGAG